MMDQLSNSSGGSTATSFPFTFAGVKPRASNSDQHKETLLACSLLTPTYAQPHTHEHSRCLFYSFEMTIVLHRLCRTDLNMYKMIPVHKNRIERSYLRRKSLFSTNSNSINRLRLDRICCNGLFDAKSVISYHP